MERPTKHELVPIEKLIPYVNNARTHSEKQIQQIADSIDAFGFNTDVLIDSNYGIIVGHGRVLAAKKLGLEFVPCAFIEHLTEAQKRAYIIADNKTSDNAGWDLALLKTEVEELIALNINISLLGFSDIELSKIINSVDDAEDDDYDVDKGLKKPPFSKKGDVWLLGPHRLVCGDSTKPGTFIQLMDGKKANLVITDPPYNVNYEGAAGKITNDNMADQAFFEFLLSALKNTESAMARDASIYVFHADTEGINFRNAFSAAGFYLSATCIWMKQTPGFGFSPYKWKHEPILFGWKKKGKHLWYGGDNKSTIWEFDKPRKSELHPTMKPIPLIANAILNSSTMNCIVLDPFGGSGSTIIACEQTGRIGYMIELEEKFCDVIVERYIEYVQSFDNVFLERDGETLPFDEVQRMTAEKSAPDSENNT